MKGVCSNYSTFIYWSYVWILKGSRVFAVDVQVSAEHGAFKESGIVVTVWFV